MKGVNTSGDRIGHYRLLEILGEGGMGVVHLATDPQGRKVAIKVLRPQVATDATALRRLAREVDTMRRVHSPHVAEILDADVTAERPYIVTQFVPGRTLEETVFEDGPMRGRSFQRLATGLGSALAAIHGAGVIHRDLKPGNVMMLDGEPVLIDFGIAQGMDATRLTATGLVIGTPGYLAPEIIEGEDAGAPADVHSWAATLVYAATGRPPFGSGTFESIFYKIMQGTPDLDGVPEAMLPLIRSAMAHHPAERPTAITLVQLARRIDLDATLTDQTRADTPFQMFTPAPPEPVPAPAPPRPLQQPKDFKGLLPPAAPPPAPSPVTAPQPRNQQPKNQRMAQQAAPPAYASGPPVQQPYPPYSQPPAQPPQTRRGAARQQPDPQPSDPRAPQRPQSPAAAGRGQGGEAERRKPYGLYRLCSLAALACVLGFAAILPTLTLLFVVAAVLVLRAADRAAQSLESKRTRRGKSGGDVFGAVMKAPLALPRALLKTLLLTPIGLFAGAVLVLVLMVVYPDMTIVRAGTYGAMAVIGLHFLGPGSTGPRRQVARIWATFLPRPEPAAIIALGLTVFAFVLFGLSAGKTPDLQPLHISGETRTLDGLKSDIQSWIDIGN